MAKKKEPQANQELMETLNKSEAFLTKHKKSLIIALIALVFATIYMFTIPMPTGFDFASFFAAK